MSTLRVMLLGADACSVRVQPHSSAPALRRAVSHCEHTCKSGGESHKGALEAMVCDCRPCLALPVGLTASPGLGDSMEHSPWCWAMCGALLCATEPGALRAAGGQPELADVTLIPGFCKWQCWYSWLQSWKGGRVLRGCGCCMVLGRGCSVGRTAAWLSFREPFSES